MKMAYHSLACSNRIFSDAARFYIFMRKYRMDIAITTASSLKLTSSPNRSPPTAAFDHKEGSLIPLRDPRLFSQDAPLFADPELQAEAVVSRCAKLSVLWAQGSDKHAQAAHLNSCRSRKDSATRGAHPGVLGFSTSGSEYPSPRSGLELLVDCKAPHGGFLLE